MSAPSTLAHSPFGGSVAARVLRCAASVGLVQKVPAHLRRVSIHADRGTALHSAMALALDTEAPLERLVGKTFNNYTLTRDDVENALRPVYDHVDALLSAPGAAYFLEQRVIFPDIADTFGTCDLLIRTGRVVHVIDFKFGSGVLVRALHPDGDEDVINAQLMFYAAAARHSLPAFFAGAESIALTILQPQSIELDAEMVSTVAVAHAELDEFIAVYRAACAQALAPAPHLERGEHCRFCPARPLCPAHTAPLLDFAQFALPATPPSKESYLQLLAAGLNLVDAIKDIRTALHDQAKRAFESGDVVPGYALSAGRAERHWRDENAAITALRGLGLTRDDIVARTMRSPKQVEIRAKARGLKIPPALIDSRRSGVALVRSENARVPVPGRSELVRLFSAALKALEGKHD
jgi:hypothetical protein